MGAFDMPVDQIQQNKPEELQSLKLYIWYFFSSLCSYASFFLLVEKVTSLLQNIVIGNLLPTTIEGYFKIC